MAAPRAPRPTEPLRDPFGPEVSDLVVDYDPVTLARRPVRKSDVLGRLRAEGRRAPVAVAQALPAIDDVLDPTAVDGVLVRAHLELQRLHEEFRVGRAVRALLTPLLDLARRATAERPLRVVDLGCGLGYITRWLAREGALADDVELLGVDYNQALVAAAGALAREEGLRCRFEAANAFRLEAPAHVYLSTGALHHFRGDDLARFFGEHQRSTALGFVHLDIRPSVLAPAGSWIFHRARMREPLAQWDGYWSAVRAHTAGSLTSAIRRDAPDFRIATVDAHPGIYMVVRIFQAILGVRGPHADGLERAYAPFGSRFALA